MPFNLLKYSGRKRIKDRGIMWEESYHDRSEPLKKRMDKLVGPGAYWRWEGHDYTTDSDYFVVVGPAVTRFGAKRFFAGIKKLPKDPEDKVFAPSGEYFMNLASALTHIGEKWGVKFPKMTKNYTVNDLKPINIPRHIKG